VAAFYKRRRNVGCPFRVRWGDLSASTTCAGETDLSLYKAGLVGGRQAWLFLLPGHLPSLRSPAHACSPCTLWTCRDVKRCAATLGRACCHGRCLGVLACRRRMGSSACYAAPAASISRTNCATRRLRRLCGVRAWRGLSSARTEYCWRRRLAAGRDGRRGWQNQDSVTPSRRRRRRRQGDAGDLGRVCSLAGPTWQPAALAFLLQYKAPLPPLPLPSWADWRGATPGRGISFTAGWRGRNLLAVQNAF